MSSNGDGRKSEGFEPTKFQMVWASVVFIIFVVVVYFIVSGVFSLVGGIFEEDTYSKEEVREERQEHLYEKYGEEFVVRRIGQRRMRDREFYQARVYPKSISGTPKARDEYYYASASLYKDVSGVGDGYGVVKMNMNAEEYLMPKAKKYLEKGLNLSRTWSIERSLRIVIILGVI